MVYTDPSHANYPKLVLVQPVHVVTASQQLRWELLIFNATKDLCVELSMRCSCMLPTDESGSGT